MRGLVGAATVVTLLGWFTLQVSEVVGRMQDRVSGMEAAAGAREDAAGIDRPNLLEGGHQRQDWKALLGRDDDLPTGIKQHKVWEEQTRKLLAGEPPTAAEERRLLASIAERRPEFR